MLTMLRGGTTRMAMIDPFMARINPFRMKKTLPQTVLPHIFVHNVTKNFYGSLNANITFNQSANRYASTLPLTMMTPFFTKYVVRYEGFLHHLS